MKPTMSASPEIRARRCGSSSSTAAASDSGETPQLPSAIKIREAMRDVTNAESTPPVSVFERARKRKRAAQNMNSKSGKTRRRCKVRLKVPSEVVSGGYDYSANKCCRGYAPSIYRHLRCLELEDKRRPLCAYMDKIQDDVMASMREILVDWLVEVVEQYKFVSDTLFLAVSYIDRFLSAHAIKRTKLQLLGVCCMLVASEYEDICPPQVEDFCYITDNTYTKEELVAMERDVLKLINYEKSSPTIITFLRIFTRAAVDISKVPESKFEFLTSYLAELSLLDYECVRFLPSVIAASVIFLARFTFRPTMHPWTWSLTKCSGYQPSDLKECVIAIHRMQLGLRRSSAKAVRQKYMKYKFEQVALLSCPEEIPCRYFEAA